jgi:DNA-directed RNA polymerase subunit F
MGWLSYEEAKEFIHKLGLKNQAEWKEYCNSGNKPDNIPNDPYTVYKRLNQWKSQSDFFGRKNRRGGFLSYQEAKEFVSKLNIKSKSEWFDYSKSGNKPDNMPSNLAEFYQNKGWINWGEFLGTGTIAPFNREYLSYQEAKEFVSKLNIKSKNEWSQYCKSGNKPDNIPINLNVTYKNKGWINWGDFLNTKYVATFNREYLSYQEAKEFVHKLNLKTVKEWKDYCKSGKKPDNIPFNPSSSYKNKGWVSMSDFLGTILRNVKYYLSYEEAKEFVHKLGLKNAKEWYEYAKSGNKPYNIPKTPKRLYQNKNKWISWGDFLGIDYIANSERIYMTYQEAREFVKKLGLKSKNEWLEYCKSGNRPDNLPSNPQSFYKLKK